MKIYECEFFGLQLVGVDELKRQVPYLFFGDGFIEVFQDDSPVRD
jgi:hypothetical protein